MMQVSLIRPPMQLVVVMRKTLTNVAPFNVLFTSIKGLRFGHVFPSIEGLLGIVEEDVGASSFQVCPFFLAFASFPSFSTSCLPQHQAICFELMTFMKIEIRNSICVEENGNKWRWAPRLPPKTLASSYREVVTGLGSSRSGGRVRMRPLI